MLDIFISYAQEDEATLRRIYDDLTRLGLKVWEFNRDGQIGVDFEEELRRMIENSRFFCLLDSSSARKSRYIPMECQYALESRNKRNFPQMIMCTIEEGFDWEKAEIFPRQNTFRAVELTVQNYANGMKQLCELFGIPYTPRFMIPQDIEFEDELQRIKMREAGLSQQDWQQLMDNYTKFREKHTSHREYAENLLRLIIFQANDLGISLKIPYLILGVMQAESNDHQQALKTFQTAAQLFHEDPRLWAGLGGAQFYLTQYEKAIESYCHCVHLIKSSRNEFYEAHLLEVVYNLEEALYAMGEYSRAYHLLTKEFAELSNCPEIQAVKGKILLKLGNPQQASPFLEVTFHHYQSKQITNPEEHQFFVALILNLAECYKTLNQVTKEEQLLSSALRIYAKEAEIWRRYAICIWETRPGSTKNPLVIDCLRKAIGFSRGNIKYRAELALILKSLGKGRELQEELTQCFAVEIAGGIHTPIDYYYLGLAYFLAHQPEIARSRYELSRSDRQIREWPFYDQLI